MSDCQREVWQIVLVGGLLLLAWPRLAGFFLALLAGLFLLLNEPLSGSLPRACGWTP